MAVAKDQIDELYQVITRYVGQKQKFYSLVHDLQTTEAYARNKSFRDTVDRLMKHWKSTL